MTSHESVDSGSAGRRRRVRAASGDELEPAEPHVASQVSRLGIRLGVRWTPNGFAAWRAYALLRGLWRRVRQVR